LIHDISHFQELTKEKSRFVIVLDIVETCTS
jgi:hypothetical protein